MEFTGIERLLFLEEYWLFSDFLRLPRKSFLLEKKFPGPVPVWPQLYCGQVATSRVQEVGTELGNFFSKELSNKGWQLGIKNASWVLILRQLGTEISNLVFYNLQACNFEFKLTVFKIFPKN